MDYQKLHDRVLQEMERHFPEETQDKATAALYKAMKEISVAVATIAIREYDREKNNQPSVPNCVTPRQ